MSFTCVEMRDCEHPPEAAAGPEQLLKQIVNTAREFSARLLACNISAIE